MGNAIRILQFGVAREAVEHQRKTLVSFDIAGTLKVFIQHGADDIAR
jgi:hypothetical protein